MYFSGMCVFCLLTNTCEPCIYQIYLNVLYRKVFLSQLRLPAMFVFSFQGVSSAAEGVEMYKYHRIVFTTSK